MPLLTTAVDAVVTLRVLSGWIVLLGEVRLYVLPSAGTVSMYLPSDYIYPYRCVCESFSQRRTRGGVGRDNCARRRLVCASQTQQTTGIPLAAPHSV